MVLISGSNLEGENDELSVVCMLHAYLHTHHWKASGDQYLSNVREIVERVGPL